MEEEAEAEAALNVDVDADAAADDDSVDDTLTPVLGGVFAARLSL